MTTDTTLQARHAHLRDIITAYGPALVAWSGGIDSSLVAYVTHQVHGAHMLAVTSGSASLKRADLDLTRALASDWGMPHRLVITDEVSLPAYRANPVNRCFYCKTSLYTLLRGIADAEGYPAIHNGTNVDDLGDHRPGLVAAENHQIRSPLVEAGFTKADVRALAHLLGLANADKPQAACLSSRFPYGTAISETLLARVERAEAVLAEAGLTQFRVRHHDDVARLEVLPEEMPLLLARREAIDGAIRDAGYRFVALDLGGFRSGSLNTVLTERRIPTLQVWEPQDMSQ
ncbi:MAG: ATP-dependent sacrificial sulfur transferase LarE [Pseudomonadales bacterium]|nr:ATP-dependent sacrificial sulfur transferase LarE [Pseudomonadales bacterium]